MTGVMEQICCNHGYVHLYHDYVLKYIYLKNSQWVKEAWILHVLLPYKHPHVGTFESMWIDKPYCVMRMPRYDKTLQYGLLPNSYQWYQVMWDITSSLCLLHSLSLIHYDIKMDNICITKEGRGVLIDFGLGEHQRNGFMLNTKTHIHYRPPENMTWIRSSTTNELHSRRYFTSDIWSLGIVFFELCTGLTVFELFQLLYHHQNKISDCFPWTKPLFWKRKLKKLASSLHHKPLVITYSEDYIYECLYRDHKETYLYFLSQVFLKYKSDSNLLWSQLLYPMLRHDPCQRISAMELYKRFNYYKTSLHFTPPLLTVTDYIERSLDHSQERPLDHSQERPLDHSQERPPDHFQERSLDHSQERPPDHFDVEKENQLLQSILKTYYSKVPQATQNFMRYFIRKGYMTKDNFSKYIRALHQIELIVEDKVPLQPILSSEVLFILQHYIYIEKDE